MLYHEHFLLETILSSLVTFRLLHFFCFYSVLIQMPASWVSATLLQKVYILAFCTRCHKSIQALHFCLTDKYVMPAHFKPRLDHPGNQELTKSWPVSVVEILCHCCVLTGTQRPKQNSSQFNSSDVMIHLWLMSPSQGRHTHVHTGISCPCSSSCIFRHTTWTWKLRGVETKR